MNATQRLLNIWMKRCHIASQTVAAKNLGTKASTVNNWVQGVSQAAPQYVDQMARESGELEIAWLALVESERARDADDRATWKRHVAYYVKHGGIAALLALSSVAGVATADTAGPGEFRVIQPAMTIM